MRNKTKTIKKLLPRTLIGFIIIFLVLVLLTKIGGEMGIYPPIGRQTISWRAVFEDIPYILTASVGITLILYLVLYWDLINKQRNE